MENCCYNNRISLIEFHNELLLNDYYDDYFEWIISKSLKIAFLNNLKNLLLNILAVKVLWKLKKYIFIEKILTFIIEVLYVQFAVK